MLIIDGTIGADIPEFLQRIKDEIAIQSIITYVDWLKYHQTCSGHLPEGIIFMRVSPEIAYNRLQKRGKPISRKEIEEIYAAKEQLFIENKNSPVELKNLPVLVLNGNIDFQTDFAQFYNHLFYIKRFLLQIQERKEIALGIHQKKEHRKCC